MLTLTPSATEAVDALLHSSPDVPDDAGLRIGTAGESQLTIEFAAEPAPGDQVIEDGGARVFVGSDAAELLDGAQLDARRDGDQIAFSLAPNDHDGAPDASSNGSPLGD
jgi:Fe-S cluster assembly iron-binding protein IscA